MRERYYQAVTRRHTGCAGAPRAGSKIRKQLDQCICKLEGAIVIATALVAAAQHAETEWICILKGAFPAGVSRAIQLADKPAWISAAEDDISLRRRHWVTSTATARGRCSSSNRPTAAPATQSGSIRARARSQCWGPYQSMRGGYAPPSDGPGNREHMFSQWGLVGTGNREQGKSHETPRRAAGG